jgi:hypothetical protein
MTKMADYLEDTAIDHLLRNQAHTPTATVYLRLYTTATTDAGGGTEATGGSYAPQAITFGAPTNGEASNTNLVTFSSMPAGTFTHCSITDDASGSPNFLFHGPLSASKTTTAGQDLEVAIGDVDVGFTAGTFFTDYSRDIIVNRFLRDQSFTPPATVYLASYTSATDRTGGGTESTGGSYARQAVELDAASGGATANTNNEDFTNMPSSTITDLAIHDHVSAGNMMCFGTLNSSVVVPAADTFRVAAGDLTLTVD